MLATWRSRSSRAAGDFDRTEEYPWDIVAVGGEADGLRMTRREATMGLRGIPEGELVFEDLQSPARMLLNPPSGLRRGFADLMNAYNSQRVGAGRLRWA